jgi:hypothetical protein
MYVYSITVGGKYRQNTKHSEMFSHFLKNSSSLGGVNFFFLPSCIPLGLQRFFLGRGAYREEEQSVTVML